MSDEAKSESLATIDISELDAGEVLERLRAVEMPETIDHETSSIELRRARGGDNLLMGLDKPWRINVRGTLGDYALAFNRLAHVRVTGSVGDGLGESMVSGAVRVHGNAGVGVGVAMTGGTLAVYGNAGDGCAAALRGGEVFVRGDVGHNAAHGALHGTLVIGGDAGMNLGEAMMDAMIFIRGRIGSLGQGVAELPLIPKDSVRLGLLLINAGIRGDAKDFRRIVPQRVFDEEQRRKGIIGHPSWR
ncbi:tributyrin esterase [Rosistilla oblonga]|uniref:tributyrin esterase n=1 Tax=Rosistilla oblonga TaxID=2527990 RepID=UPI003A96C63C